MRQLGQAYRKLFKPFREIMRGCLPLQRGVHGQHDFIDTARGNPANAAEDDQEW